MTKEQRLEFQSAIRYGIEQAIDHALVNGWFTHKEADAETLRTLQGFVKLLKPEEQDND